ncbi:MAG TPA: tRNA (adenosine(37)-N6)-threonylcarbamoyltransferase complex dimerization subunit type 1 TsaB [Pyrinomonadaceae bacterium]|nr:tRNA (adenosine(37)-N6)-threonylcarbamoyltransferase complex dimerization subunit type 1 TsaB [Pyrinomonadaceae bacterium]
MNNNNKITLAIESAIAGGSLALYNGGEIIASRLGDDNISRAEALLVNIAEMLDDSGVKKTDLGVIAVSLGPGSFTGIRIGIATALGLKNALGVECVGFSTLEAIAQEHASLQNVIAAVPVGKVDVACQWFGKDGLMFSDPISDEAEKFLEYVQAQPKAAICAHTQVIERFGDRLDYLGLSVVDVGRDLASYIASSAAKHPGSHSLEPIYLRNSRYTGIG